MIRLTLTSILFASLAQAQDPQLTSIFPAGGQRGTTVEIALEGKDLKDADRIFVAGANLIVPKTATGKFALALPADLAPGDYDVWAVTPKGLSNPRRFAVGTLPEQNEKPKNDDAKSAEDVKLPIVLNGMLETPFDRDYFRFDLSAGQEIAIHFRSETLDGSARPALTVFGPSGKELRHDDGRDAEPMMPFQAPEAGSYVLKLEERAYGKGDNNVYRLALLTGPYAVGVYPQVLQRGTAQEVAIFGYRLPGGVSAGTDFPPGMQSVRVRVKAPQQGDADAGGYTLSSASSLEGFHYRHPEIYGDLRFGLTDGPVLLDGDRRHARKEDALAIPTPSCVAGRFVKPRQVDWYRFPAKKGHTYWIEAVGERDGKVMDLDLAIHDAKGAWLETFGDFALGKKETAPFPINTYDAKGAWKAEADGDYLIAVRDLFGTTRWGVDRTYRLSVDKRRESVSVAALPTAPNQRGYALAPGGSVTIPLLVQRLGGHEGPIVIRAVNFPAGVTASEVTLDKQAGTFTLSAAKDAAPWIGTLTLTAEAKLDGKSATAPVLDLTLVRAGLIRRTAGVAVAVLGNTT